MTFEQWYAKEVFPLNKSGIYKAGLKQAWNAALKCRKDALGEGD